MQARNIPLSMAAPSRKVTVVSLAGGKGLTRHLVDMGLDIGSEIEVIKPGKPGPFLIAVKETRLAIGHGIAHKIIVRERVEEE